MFVYLLLTLSPFFFNRKFFEMFSLITAEHQDQVHNTDIPDWAFVPNVTIWVSARLSNIVAIWCYFGPSCHPCHIYSQVRRVKWTEMSGLAQK